MFHNARLRQSILDNSGKKIKQFKYMEIKKEDIYLQCNSMSFPHYMLKAPKVSFHQGNMKYI